MSKSGVNNILLTGGVVDLDKFVDEAEVIVREDSVLNAINLHNNMKLKIKVLEGKKLVLNIFDYAVELETTIDVVLNDRSSLIFNDVFIAETKYALNVNTNLYGDDIEVSVNIRGINEENGTATVIMNGTVAGETKNSKLNEYAKILNKSNASNVLIPNIIVNTSEVEANHGVTVGSIDDEELFYLKSKGINEANATKIIEDGFLLSILDDDIKERVKNILVGR